MTAIRENGATSGIGVLAAYSYDALGRRSGADFGNGTARSYGYDAVSRLAGIKLDLAGTASDQVIGQASGSGTAISYNPASQIAAISRSNDAYSYTGRLNVNRSYATNGLNQHTASGAVALGYDLRGNLNSSGTSAYGYDKLNQLTSGPNSTALSYDGTGRLIQYSAGAATRFSYAGSMLIAELSTAGAIQRRYVP